MIADPRVPNTPSRVNVDRFLALIVAHQNDRLWEWIEWMWNEREGCKSMCPTRGKSIAQGARQVLDHPRYQSRAVSDVPTKRVNSIWCCRIHASYAERIRRETLQPP
jgi:hypothetical protein